MKRVRDATSPAAKRARNVASLIRDCAARASFTDFFIYTDGSDLKHAAERRKGGSVVVVREKKVGTRGFSYDADSVIKDLSLSEKWARNASFSNPTAEILAATAALDAVLRNANLTRVRRIVMYQDYIGVQKYGIGEWKRPRPNPSDPKTYIFRSAVVRFLDVLTEVRKATTVVFEHVRAHTGDPGNELADCVAKMGADAPDTLNEVLKI